MIIQLRGHVLPKDRFLGTTNVVSKTFVAKSDISSSEAQSPDHALLDPCSLWIHGDLPVESSNGQRTSPT